jgi:hypothetical protein
VKEEMASRIPPPSKWGRREDDDDESHRRKKLEKGKEPTAKDADEKPLFDDTKFVVELHRSAFRKLEGIGEAFDIKAHHDVYKDPSMRRSRTSPWSSRLPGATSSPTATAAATAVTTTTMAVTAAMTVGI